MSRTYRRKNAWNKKQHIDYQLGLIEYYTEFDKNWKTNHNFYRFRYGNTEDQILAKINALFHGETPPNWDHKCYAKEFSKWYMRNLYKMEFITALKTGTEEELQLSDHRCVNGIWWLYD